MTALLNWAAFEQTLTDALTTAVRSVITTHRDEQFYAAALAGIYREQNALIALPTLGLNSIQALSKHPVEDQPDLRWSVLDWEHVDDDWLPDARSWEQALTAEACRDTTAHWESTFQRYLMLLVRVCQAVRRRSQDLLILVLDDEHHELLIRDTLTPSDVRRYFPELDVRAAEAAQVAALPGDTRAAYYVSRLDSFDSEEAESALRRLGPAAVPALVEMLAVSQQAWQAAKLLGEIGQADDSVVRALDAALTRCSGPDQAWIASALSFLGRLDLVFSKRNQLPHDVVVTAICAPYTSFRNYTLAPRPLDYRPLEEVFEHHPGYAAALAEELAPGRGHCDLSPAEAAEANRALTSSHPAVRRHAALCLEALHR
ncbi:DUF4303 domain-containing protein [Kribbella antibiotica]|uniref:DUF4303 domain-containing protein n=1 Tax=Kribbella antibiotica TaxID=190195 RepID=UPI001404486F|nr:DUF4303 domain-containing protein [Kribbella antibiotica]